MDESHYMTKAKEIIKSVKGRSLSVESRRETAIELAALMMNESRRTQTYSEQTQQDQLARMMDDPAGTDFTTIITDECFRSSSNRRVADQLNYIMQKFGIPSFLGYGKRIPLSVFKLMGKGAGTLIVPLAKKMIRNETSKVILPAERHQLRKHIHYRTSEGVRININHLGEAILGEDEAVRRLNIYLDDLARPEIEYVSIKISTIFSQLNLLAREETIEILTERLRQLFRAAMKHKFKRPDGKEVSKFVNLDMEEYRDLNLTAAVFRRVLDEPEFFHFSAGIVLQAYLPDAYLYQQELTLWALQRVASGGAPIKMRLVKGANLMLEQLEARLKCWTQAPYVHKVDVDANYKRMLTYACQPEHAKAVHVGIGSHNLFDIAYALLLREECGVSDCVSFEMLEGMADHIRRVVQKLSGGMLLYCPVAHEDEFQYAIAYLVRRLDENTAPENFLRHAFSLIPGTRDWQQQASLFSLSCHAANSVSFKPRRTQNRLLDPPKLDTRREFRNEADTDWSLVHNCKWCEGILQAWKEKEHPPIPLVINGEEVLPSSQNDVASRPVRDPSRPDIVLCEMSQAGQGAADQALNAAIGVEHEWADMSARERSEILAEVAGILRAKRGELIGAMAAEGGKFATEADIEVTEAVDFVEYYRRSVLDWDSLPGVRWKPKGVTLVLPPWNFPCAIPTGGVAAALAAGNPVILKPAPEATLIGYEVAKTFWEGGISKKVLQFLPCKDEPVGTFLVQDPRVKKVVLTGSTETAKRLMKLRPGLDLCAETGGKNGIIVTAMSDRDLAIRDILHSAFSHSGQKCSACSLLVLEKEVHDDPHFLQQLADAAKSLKVGSAWDLGSRVNPLISLPSEHLKLALTQCGQDEKWLLEPKQDPDNPQLWSPGIKLGVKPGSFSHQTEFFGPVLSVMRAENLEEAIQMVNSVPYGLTSGIHTLDEREQNLWRRKVEAGNLYINRGITGAVVERQPFGGYKASSFGSGIKTGGPNYVTTFMKAEPAAIPAEPNENIDTPASITGDAEKIWRASIGDYRKAWKEIFSQQHDPASILGQDNILKYRPRKSMILRVQTGDSELDVRRIVAAAEICGTPIEVSSDHGDFEGNLPITYESEEELFKRVRSLPERTIRLISDPPSTFLEGCAELSCNLMRAPVVACGRVELLHYLREQSISYDYHRYGNIAYKDAGKRNPQS